MNEFFPHFQVDYSKNRSNKEAIFQGQTYRITVLSERLLRLEYNKDGIFFDDLTEQVINRNFEVPEFQIQQDDKFLEITKQEKEKKTYKPRTRVSNEFREAEKITFSDLKVRRLCST